MQFKIVYGQVFPQLLCYGSTKGPLRENGCILAKKMASTYGQKHTIVCSSEAPEVLLDLPNFLWLDSERPNFSFFLFFLFNAVQSPSTLSLVLWTSYSFSKAPLPTLWLFVCHLALTQTAWLPLFLFSISILLATAKIYILLALLLLS